MHTWFKARWKAYMESADSDVAMAASTPVNTVSTVGVLSAIFIGLAYIPPLARISGFENVWGAVALTLIAGSLTYTAWRYKCRGTIGSLATLLDNSFYSAALAFAAMNTRGNVAVALSVVHALVLVLFPGQLYAFCFLLALSMALPLGVMLLVFQPELPVVIITVCATVAMLIFSEITRNRRQFARRQRKLEEALGAADRIADESIQAALTTTLLTLGHFLHELRNYQTAISTNLDFIRLKAQLSDSVAQALEEAQAAQAEQETLVRTTIAELKSRSRPADASFCLSRALEAAAAEASGIEVIVVDAKPDIYVTGNPEHIRIVLLNLIRNAEQAHANAVRIDQRLEPSGQSVLLLVHDDGHGISDQHKDHLFDSFALSTKAEGSGLGLYLVRRYVELLGGDVRVQDGPLGGAAFAIRLPVRVVNRSVAELRAANG